MGTWLLEMRHKNAYGIKKKVYSFNPGQGMDPIKPRISRVIGDGHGSGRGYWSLEPSRRVGVEEGMSG